MAKSDPREHEKMRAATPANGENARFWRELMVTDPGATKPFDRGNFKGTDISPVWRFKRLTETFGPAGLGWGVEDYRIEYVERGDSPDIMVYVTARIWYVDPDTKQRGVTPPGAGGDFVRRSTQKGTRFDDEALKKAMTDAICNATRYLGLSADIYMGLFDSSKYVNSMDRRFEEKAVERKEQRTEQHPGDREADAASSVPEGSEDQDRPKTTPATEAELPDADWVANVIETLAGFQTAADLEDFKERIRPRFLTLERNLKVKLAAAFKEREAALARKAA